MKPFVELSNQDGNAFAIIGRCHKAARKEGWSSEQWEEVRDKMLSAADYNNLLMIVVEHFEVE